MRHDVLGLHRDGGIIAFQRVIVAHQLLEDLATVVVGVGVLWLQRDRAVIAVKRVLETLEGFEGIAAIVKRLNKVRAEREGAIIALKRFIQPIEALQDTAAIRMRFGIIFALREGATVTVERIVKPVEGKQRIAAIIEHIGMVRPQRECAIISRESELVLPLRSLNHSKNVGCVEMVWRTGNNILTNLLRFTQSPGLVRRNRKIKSHGRIERGARHCTLSALTKWLDRHLAGQLVELRQQFGWKRQSVANPIGASLRALFTWQSYAISRKRPGIAQFPDVPIDFSLEVVEGLESARIERDNELARICDFVGLR